MRRSILLAAWLCLCIAGAARAADHLVLQLKWLPQAQFAGYYVAAAKGFYRRAGLAVEIVPGGPAITPSETLKSGRADVAVDWLPAELVAREEGLPVVNFGQIFQGSSLGLTCRRDYGIRRPQDLRGETVSVWFAGNQYPLLAWLAKLGLRSEGARPDVRVVHQGAGVELLLHRRIACISTTTYNETLQLLDAGVRPAQVVVFRYQDFGAAPLEDGLYTLEKNLAAPAMRQRLARFLRATAEGWRYAIANQRETVAIVLRAGASGPGRQHEMLREVAELVADQQDQIGWLDPAAYERTVQLLLAGAPHSVLRQKPVGAWTHAVYDEALTPSAAAPAQR
jgi:NitT/TauT family transport system substrate-binding protein